MRVLALVGCLWCAASSVGLADVIVGAATGLGHVRVIDGQQVVGLGGIATPEVVERDLLPFETANTGSRVATGDINGDGFADIVAGTGPTGLPSQLKIYDGESGNPISNFFAFSTEYSGGVNVASGDVDGVDGDDVLVGAATGIARVRVIDASTNPAGEVDPSLVSADFFAFPPSFTGGVTVASGDVNNDGQDDIITGAADGLAHVRVVDATQRDNGMPSGEIDAAALVGNFFAFGLGYSGGVNVASGDVNNDGFDDVIVGAANGIAHVRVIDGSRLDSIVGEVASDDLLADFFAFDTAYAGGVNVAAGDINGDGFDDIILGAATGLAHVRIVDASQVSLVEGDGTIATAGLLADFYAYDPTYTGGVFVAASPIPEPSSLAVVLGLFTATLVRRQVRRTIHTTSIAD